MLTRLIDEEDTVHWPRHTALFHHTFCVYSEHTTKHVYDCDRLV